jgi:hypothetical protein
MRPSRYTDPAAPPRRDVEVTRLRRVLLRQSYPRLQMALIVALTGAVGLLASFVLLHGVGLESMTWRYPAAVAIAYAAFLGLLRVWLQGSADAVIDAVDTASELLPARRGAPADAAGLDAPGELGVGWDGGDALGVLGLDEGLPVIVLLALVALCFGLVAMAFSVVWSAPVLFAELLFDAALALGLYRRLRAADRRHWLESALRHTGWPFAVTLLSSCIVGALLHGYAPAATTLAQVFAGS